MREWRGWDYKIIRLLYLWGMREWRGWEYKIIREPMRYDRRESESLR